jgi:hypothetical protein
MNEVQKEACRLMDVHNIGAIITRFGWTWKETCRNNADAAAEVVAKLKDRK